MTVIAAYLDRERGTVALGADSQLTIGTYKSKAAPKVVQRGRVLLGFAGQHLFRRFWHDVTPPADEPVLDWCWRQQDAFQELMRSLGHGSEQGSLRGVDLWAIVASQDGLYELSGSGDVVVTQEPYAVAGAGAAVAGGALHALHHHAPELGAEAIVRAACWAACTHVEGCAGPVLVSTICW